MNRILTCLVLAIATGFVGCGGGDDIPLSVQNNERPDPNTTNVVSQTPNNTSAKTPTPIPANHVLVGNWKGNLIATAEQLAQMGCQAVTLELEFAASGEMAMLATMTNAEGTEEQSGIATWSIAGAEGNKYTIRSQEAEGEYQELVIEMIDTNTMVVNAAEGGQFRLQRTIVEQS